jgi:shikimate kinase
MKSSSAVSNAVVLASARALGARLSSMELVLTGVEESIKTGVTITGAFDDAAACFLGGVVVTDNRMFSLLSQGNLDPDLEILFHVPDRQIRKSEVKKLDFNPIKKDVEKALDLALRGEYLKALEANSRAYSRVLDVSEDAAHVARMKGALAAGISGTGPATTVIATRGESNAIEAALKNLGGRVLRAHVNDTPAEEVVPRLL